MEASRAFSPMEVGTSRERRGKVIIGEREYPFIFDQRGFEASLDAALEQAGLPAGSAPLSFREANNVAEFIFA